MGNGPWTLDNEIFARLDILLQVTQGVWKCLNWVDKHHKLLISGVIGWAAVYLVSSFMLVFGAVFRVWCLFLPWMVSNLVMIICMVVISICWTFLSFFVNLLIAIVFPVLGGLVLGVWIYLWRRVCSIFILVKRRRVGKSVVLKNDGYKQVSDIDTGISEEKSKNLP